MINKDRQDLNKHLAFLENKIAQALQTLAQNSLNSPLEKLRNKPLIEKLRFFREQLSNFSDEDVNQIIINLNKQNSLILPFQKLENSKKELLAKIRQNFPIGQENFGLPTDKIKIEKLDPTSLSAPIGIEIMNLQALFYESFLDLIEHFGYDLATIEQFTGSYNSETVRVNPYTFVFFERENLILAESFVQGNALFIFNISKMPPSMVNGKSFREIAVNINAFKKSELLDKDWAIRIPHQSGFKGSIIAIINLIKDGGTNNIEKSRTAAKPIALWLDELEVFINNNQRLPLQRSEGEEKKLARFVQNMLPQYQVRNYKYATSEEISRLAKLKESALKFALEADTPEVTEKLDQFELFIQTHKRMPRRTKKVDSVDQLEELILARYIQKFSYVVSKSAKQIERFNALKKNAESLEKESDIKKIDEILNDYETFVKDENRLPGVNAESEKEQKLYSFQTHFKRQSNYPNKTPEQLERFKSIRPSTN